MGNVAIVNSTGPHQALGGDAMSQRLLSNKTASTQASPPRPCWKCGEGLGRAHGLFCGGCGTVQPPSSSPTDAYVILGGLDEVDQGTGSVGSEPAYRYDIDLRELERRYKELQKVLHPDKFSSASPAEREYSAEQAIRVNMAYAALKDPLSRADCLLQVAGEEDEEGKTIGTLPHHSDMLMTFMEWREEIEDARDEETLMKLRERIQDKIDESIDNLKASFDVDRDTKQAKEEVQVLRYLVRMQDAILEKL